MFHLMAYNKDKDRYDEWQSGTLQGIQAEALFCRNLLRSNALIDINGEPYDWMEIWDDMDGNGAKNIIITGHKLGYRGNYYDSFEEIEEED